MNPGGYKTIDAVMKHISGMRKEASRTYRASSVRIAYASIMHRYASLREVDIFRVIFTAVLELSRRSIAIPAASAPFCGFRANRNRQDRDV